jgi:hypothetical protein
MDRMLRDFATALVGMACKLADRPRDGVIAIELGAVAMMDDVAIADPDGHGRAQ